MEKALAVFVALIWPAYAAAQSDYELRLGDATGRPGA